MLRLLSMSILGYSPSGDAKWTSTSHEIPRTFETRMFITAFTITRHMSLS
jgi:hypothetical protein